MDAIIKFFTGLMTGITTAFDFLLSSISDLVYVIGLLGQFVVEIPSYFSWLPSEVLVLIVTTFSIVVIYMVLNRK